MKTAPTLSSLQREYRDTIAPRLVESRGYKNLHQVPRMEKIVINCSVGSAADPKAALDEAVNDLTLIAGQRPVRTIARKSISNFKLRAGQEIGCRVTLRGRRMNEFLERFINAALARIRDFRGVSPRAFDGQGNYTFGISDHTIFPEIELEKVKRALGMDITLVTSAKNDADGRALLEALGMPFSDKPRTEASQKN